MSLQGVCTLGKIAIFSPFEIDLQSAKSEGYGATIHLKCYILHLISLILFKSAPLGKFSAVDF